jgi:hypothetical protein
MDSTARRVSHSAAVPELAVRNGRKLFGSIYREGLK